jgi:hypothetical protein
MSQYFEKNKCYKISWNNTIFAADWFKIKNNQLIHQKHIRHYKIHTSFHIFQ